MADLHGDCSETPILQHVTTACHHCIELACLEGCPVNAFDKDPVTGIVRHLDDQCIGCQYCMLKCPYDVPKYSHSKGIVRKCDMSRDRLAVGEAPACVQSCPNEAIRIRIVDQQAIIHEKSPKHPGRRFRIFLFSASSHTIGVATNCLKTGPNRNRSFKR